MKISIYASCICIFCFLGCGSMARVPLTPEGDKVRVVKDSVFVKDCRFIKSIFSRSAFGHPIKNYEFAMNSLRNQVAALNGNLVLMTSISNTALGANAMGGAGANMSGDAYFCKTQVN